MDPVTITATVITFATAVKDLVELGQKIQESFAKVSKNRRSAQRAAENINSTIADIDHIYRNHQKELDNMEQFGADLKDLLKKLCSFHESIGPLLPQRDGSWNSASFLRGWWHNNTIKDSLLDLEADVREVKQRYMMKSAMRTEVKQEANYQDTTRRLEGLSQGLEVVKANVHAIRVSTTAAPIAPTTLGTDGERERNVVLFVRSAMSKSASLLRPPDKVTEEMMTTIFIKSQIACIEAEVDKISALHVSGPSNTAPFRLSLTAVGSVEVSCLRRIVVQAIMELRNILSDFDGLPVISIDNVAGELSFLSMTMDHLDMTEEAILVCSWAARLAQTLVNSSRGGGSRARASLAFNLYTLSYLYHSNSDIAHSGQQEIEQALWITEHLLSQDCTGDAEIQGLRADILIHDARYAPDNESALNRCMQAIHLLEGIFDIQALVRVDSHGPTGAVTIPSYDLVDHLFSLSPEPIMLSRCADALQHLATYMLRSDKFDSAKYLAHMCITLQRRMVSVYGHTQQSDLASTLSSLCRGEVAQCFTDNELLDMVDECTLLFRQLTQTNPVIYSKRLLYILRRRAEILHRLNRHSDSISTWEEVIRLACQITQDFDLQKNALFQLAERFCDANMYLAAFRAMSRISAALWDGSHALLFRRLSDKLLDMGLYKESVESANNSIIIFRNLGLKHPDMQWTSGLVAALCVLGQSLILLGEKDQGIAALDESANIAGNVLDASLETLPVELDVYLETFGVYLLVKFVSKNVPPVNIDDIPIFSRLRHLAARHPQNNEIFAALWQAQVYYTYYLYCIGRLQDGLHYIYKLDENWATKPGVASDDMSLLEPTVWNLWIKANTLSAQGRVTEALSCIQSFQSTHHLSVGDYSTIMLVLYSAQLEVNLGMWDRGLDVCEQALERLRSNTSNVQGWPLFVSLFGVAYAALHARNYRRTMEVAGDAIQLSSDSEWQANEDEFDVPMRPSLFAIMSSAEANTGGLSRAIDYARQAVVLSLDIAERKPEVSVITATQSLMETRGYLAEVLVATGEVTQAREICEEQRAYFTERVKDRMGEYRDLAPILRMLGVLCCHEGRHDDGEAAARELTEIIQRLGLVFPSLQEQVKIRLRYQASVPILKVLDEMVEKLDCDHQRAITDLFKD